METNIDLSTKAIQVFNEESVFTLKIDKVRLIYFFRVFIILAFYITLSTALVYSYNQNAAIFSELAKVAFIALLLGFIAFHPINNFKK